MQQEQYQFDWVCAPGERPESDDGYFERMCRTIFQAGLNWKMIEKKWPDFQRAFSDFAVDDVAAFSPSDVDRLMHDATIVRNEKKIVSTLTNAAEFRRLSEQYGSFAAYLDSLDKSENYSKVATELTKRFRHLGPASARIFLYSVGEPIAHDG